MVSKNQIFYIVSNIQKSLAFEWISVGLKNHYNLTFVLFNSSSSSLEYFLKENGINVIRITYQNKKNLPLAFLRLCWIFITERPAIVHAHLFDATLIGLAAAWITRIKKRIYTRHNSTFHHLYFPSAVKYDRWSNSLATQIISISQATDKTLLNLEHVSNEKLVRIPHGFDMNALTKVGTNRAYKMKEKWGIQEGQFVIGVIARQIEWKGIQFIIPAFIKFVNENPAACLVLANASGPYSDEITRLIKPIRNNVILIPFEEDIVALYSIFDIYVHVPIDPLCEAFGQTYVEALAIGIPSIFTLSGIAAEFIINERNALVVGFKDAESIYLSMERLKCDPNLRARLIENGRKDVSVRFSISSMLQSLKILYG